MKSKEVMDQFLARSVFDRREYRLFTRRPVCITSPITGTNCA